MKIEDLVKKAQRGDDEAFTKLISSNKEKLYRIAFSYLKNQHHSLEAIQETTFRAYRSIGNLKEARYFDSWVTKILINYCIAELKKGKKVIPMNDKEYETNPARNVDSSVKIDVEDALEMLKPEYRQVIILKYFEDLSLQDISIIMNAPVGTIKTWAHRALGKLKEILNKGGDYNA